MYFRPIFVSLGLLQSAIAKVEFLGVAIAGGEFGCKIDATCPSSSAELPLSDGPKQINHFVKEDGINLFRLPTSWQFLVNDKLGADLDTINLSKYDQLVQACLDTGAYCMIDIHNFPRWDGEIIGQGNGPTDEQFASFWGQLASHYGSNHKIVFELMNEPHDLDVAVWAETCQKAVTAIRNAGAGSQMILLPGIDFDSAATIVSSGSADALLAITNPDGGTDNLVLDIHKYLDQDNSGTHVECTTDNVETLTGVANYLRERGRKGLISETGASDHVSCFTSFCAQNDFINNNSDVFLGIVAWGAGSSFGTDYILSMTPSLDQKGRFIDATLMKRCLLEPWNNKSNPNNRDTNNSSKRNTTTTPTRTSGMKDSDFSLPPVALGSGTLILSTVLYTTPTALLTATATATITTITMAATAAALTSNGTGTITSSGGGGGVITSNLLILTDIGPAAGQAPITFTTLAIATDASPTGRGIGGLLTAGGGGGGGAGGPAPTAPVIVGPGGGGGGDQKNHGSSLLVVGAGGMWRMVLFVVVGMVAWV
ncbi:glycoside hydrolase family 5 protein [Xylariaceae sp. FL0594]|nr:glycoside hydrolase family 5 protein [Xylariaceae sp. FL0594]